MDAGTAGLTVACVCVPGGEYRKWHVDRLAKMVSRHLSRPYAFQCLTASDKPGWWAKIDLFEPGRFSGRVLYLDLDVDVMGALDDLAAYPAPFAICRDFLGPRFNSSVMAWDAGAADRIHTNFTPDVMDRLHGDQNWIAEQMPDARTFPLGWCVSYKASGYRAPKSAKVVVYHGRPKPWEVEC